MAETGEGILRDADEIPEPEIQPASPPPEKPHIRDCRCLPCRRARIMAP